MGGAPSTFTASFQVDVSVEGSLASTQNRVSDDIGRVERCMLCLLKQLRVVKKPKDAETLGHQPQPCRLLRE